MGIKQEFKRKSGFRDAKLIIIACEGQRTETIYFNAIKNHFRSKKTHIEVLERFENASSPKYVLKMLDQFKKEYKLNRFDELWLVCDVDNWTEKELAFVASECIKKLYLTAISNPCFEIWFLLHFSVIAPVRKLDCNEITNELQKKLGSYNKRTPPIARLIEKIPTAIKRAKKLDLNHENKRWPSNPGTRVYKLIHKIINTSH